MNDQYRKMMEQQSLSEQTRQEFYQKIQKAESRKGKPALIKAALIAACICLMLPITVYAAEQIFGISIVEIFENMAASGSDKTGFRVEYPGIASRPLTDFAEEIRTSKWSSVRAVCDSWEDAEAALGIKLIDSAVLSGDEIHPAAHEYLWGDVNTRIHCRTDYHYEKGQLYRAMLTAWYRYRGMDLKVTSTVTAQHPDISKEEEYLYHWTGTVYQSKDIETVTSEEYIAKNGVRAVIVTVDWARVKDVDYEVCFAANGASYRITVNGYGKDREEEAKAVLIELVESFAF